MKRILTLMLAALLLLPTLSGCRDKSEPDPDDPVTLTIWHSYGSQTESPLNESIEEFNRTVGAEQGVFIAVDSVTDSAHIDEMLEASLDKLPGALELPDLFTAYPRVAEKFSEGQLLDWSGYFTEEELSAFRPDFLSAGRFDSGLLALPIAKSSELLFVDKTLFDRFSRETGVTLDCFSNVESLMDACRAYYDWSDGGAMFQINDFYHYFLANMAAQGSDMIVDERIDAGSDAFAAAFLPVARAGIYGGLCLGDGYASDRWKTGEVIGNIGSTAGILYLRDYVTHADNSTEDIETLVLPYPCLSGTAPTVVQRGGDLFAVHSEDERKNKAAAIFAKWLTEKQHNLDFVTAAGYFPVTDEAFDALFADLGSVENEKYRMLYAAVRKQYEGGYRLCALPRFAGAADTQRDFEKLMKATLSEAHTEYLRRTADGGDGEAVLRELTGAALETVRSALR